MSTLKELYQEIIIDHGKQPRNFGNIPAATHCKQGHNPLCGDKLNIYLDEKNGQIKDVKFEASGCAISVASASLMTEAIKGKAVEDFLELFEQFILLVTSGNESESLGKLAVFSGVCEFPVRVKCATLAWHTAKAALKNDDSIVTTE